MKLTFLLLIATVLSGCAQPSPSASDSVSVHPASTEADDPAAETPEASIEDETAPADTTICGCDDTLNLEDSTVITCLQDQLSVCQQASGGYWTDFGTNFMYIPGGQANSESCHFEIYIEEEGFRQKFECQLDAGMELKEDRLIDPYWPQEPDGATCLFIDSSNVHNPDCGSLGPSCLSPY